SADGRHRRPGQWCAVDRDTATSSCARVSSSVASLHTSPLGGTTTSRRPSKAMARTAPSIAGPPWPSALLRPTVAASTMSGVLPKVFWNRTRSAPQP
ncbi:hypothetical protein O3Q52_50435, partial [Streptomyces sp. ActVer]|uniref:hypothetical protein n=1 Tax=Streptomyces sp. ActVer TaxID=3014558 RepID=UPI0022B3B82B